MTGADVEIAVHKQGINIVVNKNANKAARQPNALQTAFSEFFYDIDSLRASVMTQGKRFQKLLKRTFTI